MGVLADPLLHRAGALQQLVRRPGGTDGDDWGLKSLNARQLGKPQPIEMDDL